MKKFFIVTSVGFLCLLLVVPAVMAKKKPIRLRFSPDCIETWHRPHPFWYHYDRKYGDRDDYPTCGAQPVCGKRYLGDLPSSRFAGSTAVKSGRSWDVCR